MNHVATDGASFGKRYLVKKLMTKHLIIALAAVAGVGTSMYAGGESLTLDSRAALRRHYVENKKSSATVSGLMRKARGADAAGVSPKVTVAFVTVEKGTDKSALEENGMRVLTMRNNIAVVEVPYDSVASFSARPFVRSFQLQRDLKAHTDKAREVSGVDAIHAGAEGLERAYTGKGVVAAIVDQGVDPNHINFVDSEGNSRIGFLSHLRYNNAGTALAQNFYGADVLDAEPISAFKSDDVSTYHGTHTLGILGGGYKGQVEMPDATGRIVTVDNPYMGAAPEASLAVSCGTLADGFIAYGMDYMYSYAKYLGKPLVYSLSLGSNSGAHDPRSTMAQFLDAVGEEAIICLSAGNEGDLKIALNKTFTATDKQIKTFVHPYVYVYDPEGEESESNNTIRYGAIEVWSDDATPFDLQAVIYNRARNRVAKRMAKVGDGVGTYYCSSADYQMDESDVVGDATFCKAFEGYVGVGGMIDEVTGRYYGMVDYYVIDSDENRDNATYILGFEVTGEEGHRVDCYGDGITTWMESYGMEGYDDGSCDGTISDMAVAHNVIVVGSYNTRNEFRTLDGQLSGYPGDGFIPGGISGFSSFGTLADGRKLPTVCAPGSTVISSMSTPFLDAVTSQAPAVTAQRYKEYLCSARATDAAGNVHYWKQEIGTSMSCPFVAGSIALWLEADPTLTVDDVRDIIVSTAKVDDDVRNCSEPVRWGAGKFDALAGLKEVIRRSSGVNDITVDNANDRLIVTPQGNNIYNVFCGDGAGSLDVAVHALTGVCVSRAAAVGDEVTVDLSGVAPGVYVLTANGAHSTKICVRN